MESQSAHPLARLGRAARLDRPGAWWIRLGGKRRPLLVLLGSVALALAVLALVTHYAGDGKVLQTLIHVSPIWLALCLAAETLAYAGYVLALRETARVGGGPRLGFLHTARVVAAGFGAFFSASAHGGFRVDYWALRRAGALRKEALARVLGLSMLEYAVLAPAAMGAALAIILGVGKQPNPSLTWPWLLVAPGFLVAIWLTAPGRRRRLIDTRGAGRMRRGVGHFVGGLAILRQLIVQPRRHGAAYLGAAFYFFGEILCLWAALRAFHADVGIPALILAYATGYAVTRRALPFGGVGAAEAFLTFALTWLGVPLAPALLGVFLYRAFNFWLALLPALAALTTVRDIRDGTPAVRAAQRPVA